MHPLYRLWAGVKRRCTDPKAQNYPWYGGRGITMHDPWLTDAEAFITYVEEHLGPRPPGKSIDRIDNDGNYEPGNLRWATMSEQRLNARKPSRNHD